MAKLKVQVKVDDRELKELMRTSRSIADRAHNSALNRATQKVSTELVDRAYQKINLRKADLKESLSVRGNKGEIEISEKPVSLSSFLNSIPKKKSRSKGVAVKVWRDRGKITYEGSFAYGSTDSFQIFKRVGRERLPIKKLHGKGVRDMWEIPAFSQGIVDIAQNTYADRFESTFFALIEREQIGG